jgi:hypothetical protein
MMASYLAWLPCSTCQLTTERQNGYHLQVLQLALQRKGGFCRQQVKSLCHTAIETPVAIGIRFGYLRFQTLLQIPPLGEGYAAVSAEASGHCLVVLCHTLP